MRARLVRGSQFLVLVLSLSCTQSSDSRHALRLWGDKYSYRVTSEPSPPHALEPARFRVVVLDKKTNQPVQVGEGQIFATSPDGANTDDGLAKGQEVGTYYGRLFFVTAGDWAVAIRFRRDSTQRLERVDWVQTVLGERAPGTETP